MVMRRSRVWRYGRACRPLFDAANEGNVSYTHRLNLLNAAISNNKNLWHYKQTMRPSTCCRPITTTTAATTTRGYNWILLVGCKSTSSPSSSLSSSSFSLFFYFLSLIRLSILVCFINIISSYSDMMKKKKLEYLSLPLSLAIPYSHSAAFSPSRKYTDSKMKPLSVVVVARNYYYYFFIFYTFK